MSRVVRIEDVDPRSDARWHQLALSPEGSVFTSPPWIRAVCDSYGFRPEGRIAVGDDGEAIAGFTWVPIDDLRGNRLVSLPFSDRAEPLCSSAEVWAELARDALDSRLPMSIRCFEDSPVVARPGLTRTGEAAWHGLSVEGSLEDITAGFAPVTRRNIRTAERNDVKVVTSTDVSAVRTFHDLHVRLRKQKYGLLAQPVEFFERIWEEFTTHDGIVTLLAYVEGEVVAGALYLVWGDVLYYKFGASVRDHLPLRPNDAIHWTAIQWASERNLRSLDWGLSDLDQPGLVRYKRKWGSTERRIVTLRSGEPVAAPEFGRLLGELTTLLTDDAVSDAVAAQAGSLLYRYFC